MVGTGDVSRAFAADLAGATGVRLRAVASRTPERGEQFATQFGFERALDLESLLADPNVDVVYIATPHATHRDLALRALAHGKHILVEKPVGVDEPEAREVAQAAASRGRFAMEAMWMRFSPLYRRLLDDLRDGVIGEVRSVRASFGMPFPTNSGSRWSAEMRGSTLLDQGIYPLTFARDILGEPVAVRASGVVRHDGVDLRQHVTLEFGDGRFAQLAASMTEFVDPTASISGTKGWIHVPFPFWAGTRFAIHDGQHLFEPRWVETPRAHNGYRPMIEAVNTAIRTGQLEHPWHQWDDVFAVFGLMDVVRDQLSTSEREGVPKAR